MPDVSARAWTMTLTVEVVRRLMAERQWLELRDRFVDAVQAGPPGAFRALVQSLTLDEREALVEQLLLMVGNGVVH
jgi:hypothetical protein